MPRNPYCVDCVAVNSLNPLRREGNSPRCETHKELKRQWSERQRQRRIAVYNYEMLYDERIYDEKQRKKPKKPETEYVPEALSDTEEIGLSLALQQTQRLQGAFAVLSAANVEASNNLRVGTPEDQMRSLMELLESSAVLIKILRKPITSLQPTHKAG